MKALRGHGKGDIRCEEVPDPKIEHPQDAIIKVTACAICGSDLHIYGGIIPQMHSGDILGHENMGEVVEVGSQNKKLKEGDRVVVPFTVSCGEWFFARTDFFRAASAPAKVARDGFDAMMAGEGSVVSGWQNKMQVAAAHVLPAGTLAKQHSKLAAPGTAEK